MNAAYCTFVYTLNAMAHKKLKLVKQDPWLEPSENELKDRLNRYKNRLDSIEKDFGSLIKMADAYKYFGIHYHASLKAFTYREWAPEAFGLYLTGDFNQWQKRTHPLQRNQYGIWEIILPKEEYEKCFMNGSKVKGLVD